MKIGRPDFERLSIGWHWSYSTSVCIRYVKEHSYRLRRRLCVLASVVILAPTLISADDRRAIGTLAHKPIAEASGIVASRQYPGVFWVHNDSGNKATIFAVRGDGTLINEFPIETTNLDWEDIAIDNGGHLYIGDIGNNFNRLPQRCVHQIDEPNPYTKPTGKLRVNLTAYYRFPDSGRFDAECLFVEGKVAYLISKRLDKKNAEIYTVPLDPAGSFLKPATASRVAELPDFTDPATGSDLSLDGQRLAVCTTDKAKVYQRTGPYTWKKLATIKDVGETIEAICWDGSDLLLAGENRCLYRIPERKWRAQVSSK